MANDKIAPANAAKAMFADLQHLVEAIDRRVPHLERLSETDIARDAADLRQRAVALMRAIEETVSSE